MRRARSRRTIGLAAQAAELSLAAPVVVALRTARMLAAGPYPGMQDRRELSRMTAEKVQAWQESMSAMTAQMYKAQVQWTLGAMRGWWALWMSPWSVLGHAGTLRSSGAQAGAERRRWQRSMSLAVEKGLAPVHKRATANVRRLSRRKR